MSARRALTSTRRCAAASGGGGLESGGDGWAVGGSGRILRLDSGTWTSTSGKTRGVYGGNGDVHVVSDENVWVAAEDRLLNYDGTDWAEHLPADTTYRQPFSRVFAVGADEAWTGGWGSAPNNIQRCSAGTCETFPRTDGIDYISGIWGTGPNDVWFVGDDAGVLHWDGSALTAANQNVASLTHFNDVNGTGPDDVWVVGSGGAVMHWNGNDWTDRSIPMARSELWHPSHRDRRHGKHAVGRRSVGVGPEKRQVRSRRKIALTANLQYGLSD